MTVIQPMHILLCLSILVVMACWVGLFALVFFGARWLQRRR